MKLYIPLEFPNPMTLLGKRTNLYCIVQLYEIHFFFRGKGYWIAYADDGKAHLSDNTGNTQWFDSCRALFNDARIDGYALEDIWGEVIVDSC